VYGYRPGWGLPGETDRKEIVRIMTQEAPQGSSAEPSETSVGGRPVAG
jgi:hypothetical protein